MDEGVHIIYVDLDRALVRIALLRERLLTAVLRNPLFLFDALGWMLQGGKARLKLEIVKHAAIDVDHLPYNQELVSMLRDEHAAGLSLVLVTDAPYEWGQAVARYLGIFDRVLALEETAGEPKGKRKLKTIRRDAAGRSFGYAGVVSTDRPIFKASQLPIVVGGRTRLAGKQASRAVFIPQKSNIALAWWKSLRPLQWSKNILVFVPAIAAHRWDELWPNGVQALGSFSLAASALYLLNDFCDIDPDRQHPNKRFRAQAAGLLAPPQALTLTALLLLAAGVAAIGLPLNYDLILAGYGIVNVLYSAVLKNIMFVDLVTVAFLYSLRVYAGGAACGIHVSMWMFAFIFFLGLSLAQLKRYTELSLRLSMGLRTPVRSTYTTDSMSLLMKTGLSAGLIAVLILALDVTAPKNGNLYATPALLFAVCALLFYWFEQTWRSARHGKITGDPIDFILTDLVSYLVVLAAIVAVWIASVF